MEYFFWTFFFYLSNKVWPSAVTYLNPMETRWIDHSLLFYKLLRIYIFNFTSSTSTTSADNLHLMRPRSLQARGYFNTQSKPRSHHIIQGFYLWSQWMRQGSHLHTSCIQGYAIFIIAVLNIAASSFQVAPDHIFIHVIHNISHDIATLEFIWSNSRAVASSRVPTVCR